MGLSAEQMEKVAVLLRSDDVHFVIVDFYEIDNV